MDLILPHCITVAHKCTQFTEDSWNKSFHTCITSAQLTLDTDMCQVSVLLLNVREMMNSVGW